MEGKAAYRNRGAMIPSLLSRYSSETRKYGTIAEGQRAGVQYLGFTMPGEKKLKQGAVSRAWGEYYAHMLQVKADRQFIENLVKLPEASGQFAEDIVDNLGKNSLEHLVPKALRP